MREIKFNGWHKDRCMMLHGIHWIDHRVWDEDGEAPDDGFYEEDIIKLQYTGLKDKNGKEIYDGDVVKLHIIIGKIIFEHGSFWVESNNGGYIAGFNFLPNNFKIIGNIYENPKLLGKL